MTEIELTIDALVIEGVSDFDAGRIGQAVERELTRLLQTEGLEPRSGHQEVVSAPLLAEDVHAPPDQIGVAIAHVVFQALQA